MSKYRIVPFYEEIRDAWDTTVGYECRWCLQRRGIVGWWYITSSADKDKLLEAVRHLNSPPEYL